MKQLVIDNLLNYKNQLQIALDYIELAYNMCDDQIRYNDELLMYKQAIDTINKCVVRINNQSIMGDIDEASLQSLQYGKYALLTTHEVMTLTRASQGLRCSRGLLIPEFRNLLTNTKTMVHINRHSSYNLCARDLCISYLENCERILSLSENNFTPRTSYESRLFEYAYDKITKAKERALKFFKEDENIPIANDALELDILTTQDKIVIGNALCYTRSIHEWNGEFYDLKGMLTPLVTTTLEFPPKYV